MRENIRKRELYAARLRGWLKRRRHGGVLTPIVGFDVTYPWGVPNSAYRAGRHTGEDYATKGEIGFPIFAVSKGEVVEVVRGAHTSGMWGAAYGKRVVIQMNNWRGRKYRYAVCHLSATAQWEVGNQVMPGDLLGWSGNTGNVSGSIGPHFGAHLHFEARQWPYMYGDDVDPNLVKRKPS